MLIINGSLHSPGTPETSILNRSFFFGDGLFEILRVFRGKILFLDQTLDRLLTGMGVLHFEFKSDDFRELIQHHLLQSVEINHIHGHGKLRIHIYREGQGEYTPLSNQPSFLIEGYSLKEDLFQSSHTISLASYQDISLSNTPLSTFSHANSLPYVLASIHAKKSQHDEALLYHKDWVASTTFGNLFFIHQKKLHTPALNCGIQQGILREQLISLATNLKIPCEQKRFKKKALMQADEIFITHPTRGIVSVHQIDNLTFNPQQFAMTSFFRNCLRQYIEEFFQ